MADDRSALAADAYVYGFPLVFNLEEVDRFTKQGMGSVPAAPFNEFSHARGLAGPADTFVTINNDTLYSIAQLDLSAGPLRLRVPATGSRYFVLQFVDAWTNNFAYIGSRATGGDGGEFLVVPPGGQVPEGTDPSAQVIEAPTRVASIVGRFACAGLDDIPAVNVLQDQLSLRPVSPGAPPRGLPAPMPVADGEIEFFEKLRVWAADFPPDEVDQAYQQEFAPLGLLDDGSTYSDLAPDLAEDLKAGRDEGKALIEQVSHHGRSAVVNGWTVGIHMFDYNVSHLGPGTLDAPEWTITDRPTARVERAVAARLGLWGNHGYEAVYAQAFTDIDGQALHGRRPYTIDFTEMPPVGAFWSITMYDVPDYYLVENTIDRYSIGDRTPAITYAPDGSLSLRIQHQSPSADEQANWLPAPDGPFRVVLRLYQPGDAILDGSYQLPPIVHRASGND